MVLGNIAGTQIYHSLSRYRDALRVSSFLIIAVESPIYFANSTYLQDRILRWVREEEEWIKANNGSTLKCIILDMTGKLFNCSSQISHHFRLESLLVQLAYRFSASFAAVTAIDTSGIDMVRELRKMLDKRSLQVRTAKKVTLRMPHS